MGFKECTGRYGLLICAVVFSIGIIISTTSPSWIETIVDNPTTGATTHIEFGPFYSRNRTCTEIAGTTEEDCSDWNQNEIDNGDCEFFSENEDVHESLCRQHNTWRALAMICLFIVVGTAILVGVATCTQCLTCGCCGGSFDMIAMIVYWIEVVLSIICWSFCISVVTTIRDEDFSDIVASEAENIADIEEVADIADGNFLWGFWVFIFSGTFLGAVCATFADWAADGSCLRCITNIITGFFACICCCKKK